MRQYCTVHAQHGPAPVTPNKLRVRPADATAHSADLCVPLTRLGRPEELGWLAAQAWTRYLHCRETAPSPIHEWAKFCDATACKAQAEVLNVCRDPYAYRAVSEMNPIV